MVTFDTPLLIYGIQRKASPENAHLVVRAKELIRRLGDKKAKIMIPAPALTEFLVGMPPSLRNPRILTDLFAVGSFNAHCAQIAAELQADLDRMKRIRQEHQIPKQCLKVDTMIVATAIAYKSGKIYTNDLGHFKEIAQNRIIIEAIPPLPDQTNLLTNLGLDDLGD